MSLEAQSGTFECETTTIVTVYKLFGYEVYRNETKTTICTPVT
jgi:hypothetical protein